MFVRSAAAAQLLGNGMKQAQQPQHKETKGKGEWGVDRHTPAFKNKQPVAYPFFAVCLVVLFDSKT